MVKLRQVFIEHPESVGETYGSHLWHAMSFGGRLVAAGVACIVHALLPFLFTSTGSRTVSDLHDRMIVKRASGAAAKTREIRTPV